jgi:hypothetical protein
VKFLEKNEEKYLLVDREKLTYTLGVDGGYQQSDPSTINLEKPACVIEGIACINRAFFSKEEWKAVIDKKSIIDIVLAGAADHRQYPNPVLDDLFKAPQYIDYASYKEEAVVQGFSAENPSTFFIHHVYSQTVWNLEFGPMRKFSRLDDLNVARIE